MPEISQCQRIAHQTKQKSPDIFKLELGPHDCRSLTGLASSVRTCFPFPRLLFDDDAWPLSRRTVARRLWRMKYRSPRNRFSGNRLAEDQSYQACMLCLRSNPVISHFPRACPPLLSGASRIAWSLQALKEATGYSSISQPLPGQTFFFKANRDDVR